MPLSHPKMCPGQDPPATNTQWEVPGGYCRLALNVGTYPAHPCTQTVLFSLAYSVARPDVHTAQAGQQLANSTVLLLKDVVWSIELFCQELEASSWEVTDYPILSSTDSPGVP